MLKSQLHTDDQRLIMENVSLTGGLEYCFYFLEDSIKQRETYDTVHRDYTAALLEVVEM